MSYIPPVGSSIHFDFVDIQWCVLAFDFTDQYSPPTWNALHFDFTTFLFPLYFEFAPEIPEPISKEMLLSLGVRFSGQVYKYWVCYIWRGQQHVRRYWEHDFDPSPWTAPWQTKFAAGVKAWQNLNESDKIYWRDIGVRRKEPLPSFQTFLSAWLKDEVNLVTFRHIRNLSTR